VLVSHVTVPPAITAILESPDNRVQGFLAAGHVCILPRFGNPALAPLGDGAVLDNPGGRLVVSTDTFVVSPLEFPGGDIGCLAVHGTLNDLAMMGATPVALAAGFVLEEGLPFAVLDRVLDSMAAAAARAGVPIVTGDTKVVERGKADRRAPRGGPAAGRSAAANLLGRLPGRRHPEYRAPSPQTSEDRAMPTYAYRCAACEHEFDRLESMSAPTRTRCPECGGRARRRITGWVGIAVKRGGPAGCADPSTSGGCCGGACGTN
jgi:putative FmdB family regulatory protein